MRGAPGLLYMGMGAEGTWGGSLCDSQQLRQMQAPRVVHAGRRSIGLKMGGDVAGQIACSMTCGMTVCALGRGVCPNRRLGVAQ